MADRLEKKSAGNAVQKPGIESFFNSYLKAAATQQIELCIFVPGGLPDGILHNKSSDA